MTSHLINRRINRRISRRGFWSQWLQDRRRSRVSSSPDFEEFVLSNFAANLLGYWKLGESVGSATAVDASGRGINGTVTAVTFGQPGIPNSALKNVIFMGDGADGTTAYAAANDTLKNAIISAGGKIFACDGNHDWDGTIETTFATYYDLASNNNGGKLYYSKVLGEMEFFFINDNPEDTDNAGGINATVAAFQASTMGQGIVNKIAPQRRAGRSW